MLAIPSPDLLVSLFASAAQVLGLLAVLFGGASVARSRSGQAIGGPLRPAGSVWPFRLVLGGLVAVSVGFLLYHFAAVDARNRRLQTNLVRSSKEQGKAVGDASLKTRSFDEQEQHERGITTDQLAAWLLEGKPMNLIDVREDEEVELGCIAGSWHKRYPDLLADPTNLEVPGKTTILLCESGNRSSELCDEFTKQHRETRFMRGGYEKWLAERRPILGVGADERSDIRAIADYPNKDRLLDTDEVTRLFTEENVLFVDVRYPGDFALGSLPGAVDIPLRKMLSGEIEPALRRLPKRPIVAPCYDKRSSFYALVLGLKLHRLGYDYRGRYSVPHEFSLPGRESAWLARWRADHEDRTLFSLIEDPLAALLLRLHGKWGNLVLAILAVVVLLRLLLAPFAFLAERDSDAQHRLAPELRAVRERFAADPVRMRRATLELLRRERIGPVRNLLGAVVQIVLFLALFGAVGAAAKQVSATALGFELGAQDATGFFPLLSTLAVATLVVQQSRTRSRKTLVVAALAAALTFALVLRIPVATHLYLLANIAWAMLLSVLTRRWLARRRAPPAPVPTPAVPGPLTPLARADHAELLGTKATRLARMKNAGLPVPDGFVVRADVTPDDAVLREALEGLAAPAFAVRSSASCEDGSAKSYAGVFESRLEVPADAVSGAISDVRGSFRSTRALALGADATTGGIVVQTMVPAQYAGVLFTEDPASAGCQRVELVAGLGEALVSGKAKPHSHCFTRTTRRPLGDERPPLDLEPLLRLGERIEGLFGAPQDVEWAYADGRFAILQARDITTRRGLGTNAEDAIANERRRLLALADGAGPDEVVFCEDQITELLPEPTAFSAAFFESLWAPGGSVDLACRELGIPYQVQENGPPLTTTVFGRTYQNAREARRRVAKGVGALASFRLARSAAALESEIRGDRIPAIERETKFREALDLARIPIRDLHELLDRWLLGFVTGTYAHVEVVNLAADVCWKSATNRLARKGHDPVALLGAGPESVLHRAFTALGEPGRELSEKIARFDAEVGFRAPHDFELSEPRYRENQELVAKLAATAERAPGKPHGTAAPIPKLSRMLQLEVDLARRFQDLKETAKHAAMREIATLRALLLELGRRHGLGERIFWLEPGEVATLLEPSRVPTLQALAERRAAARKHLLTVPVPTRITFADLEVLGLPATSVGTHRPDARTGGVRGTRVAGDRVASGRVRILRDPAAVETLRPGDILVAKHTDPCWTPAFGVVAGLVTEAGGWLSHAAILARESNLPAIVGAEGALDRLQEGQLVSLEPDGAVVPFAERRASERVRAAGTLQCSVGTDSFPVQVVDLGAGGMQVLAESAQVGPGTRLGLALGGESRDAEVAWVAQGRLGLRFLRDLSASELRDLLAA